MSAAVVRSRSSGVLLVGRVAFLFGVVHKLDVNGTGIAQR
jgi:hypothetical protein